MTKEWRKLVKMQNGRTRLLSLPISFIEALGLNPSDELEGRWTIKRGELVLEIRKR